MSIFPFTDLNFITILQKSMEGDILLNEQNFILSTISFFKKKMDSISTYCFVGKHDAVNWWFVNLGKYRYWTLGLWIERFISWGLLYTSTTWFISKTDVISADIFFILKKRMPWLNLSIQVYHECQLTIYMN